MVCVFPFVRAPRRARGCGGWEPTCQSSPLGQGLRRGAGLPRQRSDTSLPAVPTQTAGFRAEPQGSVFHAGQRILTRHSTLPCTRLRLHPARSTHFAFSWTYPSALFRCSQRERGRAAGKSEMTSECDNSVQRHPPACSPCLSAVLLRLHGRSCVRAHRARRRCRLGSALRRRQTGRKGGRSEAAVLGNHSPCLGGQLKRGKERAVGNSPAGPAHR